MIYMTKSVTILSEGVCTSTHSEKTCVMPVLTTKMRISSLILHIAGAQIAQLVESRTPDRKVVCSNLDRGAVLCP